MIAGKIESASWDDHHALLFAHVRTELFDRRSVSPARKRDRTGVWLDPCKAIRVLGEKAFGDFQIPANEVEIAREDRLFGAQRDDAQDFAGRAIADRRIILEPLTRVH